MTWLVLLIGWAVSSVALALDHKTIAGLAFLVAVATVFACRAYDERRHRG